MKSVYYVLGGVIVTAAVLLFSLQGCSESPTEKYSEFIEGYHLSFDKASELEAEGNPAIYIDKSDGIIHAYSSNDNVEMLKALVQKLNSNEQEWFELSAGEIKSYGGDPYTIYNSVTDANYYSDIMAPLLGTLNKITSEKRDALFITDFEEYTPDGQEQFEAYADDPFKSWIAAGNRIDLFYLDPYEEVNKGKTTKKRLYFTVFSYGKEQTLLKAVEDALKGRPFQPKQYTLVLNTFPVTNEYASKDKPGLDSKIITMENGLINEYFRNDDLGYEFFGLTPDKIKMDDFFKKMLEADEGKFLSKLFLDATVSDMYAVKDVDLLVEDVTADYEQLFRAKVAEDLKKDILFIKDDLGAQVWDSTKMKNYAMIKEVFERDTDTPKQAYVFDADNRKGIVKLSEVITLNKTVLEGHMKNNPEKVELRTVLDKNYGVNNLGDGDGVYKISVVIHETEGKLDLSDFSWNSVIKTGGPNKCLEESIRNVVQGFDPKGTVLHTYYIKLANTPVSKVKDAVQGRYKPNNQ